MVSKNKDVRCVNNYLFISTDIQEFYEFTLDNAAKSVEVKAEETRELAKKWESSNPPIPAEARRLAQSTIAPTSPPSTTVYTMWLEWHVD